MKKWIIGILILFSVGGLVYCAPVPQSLQTQPEDCEIRGILSIELMRSLKNSHLMNGPTSMSIFEHNAVARKVNKGDIKLPVARDPQRQLETVFLELQRNYNRYYDMTYVTLGQTIYTECMNENR